MQAIVPMGNSHAPVTQHPRTSAISASPFTSQIDATATNCILLDVFPSKEAVQEFSGVVHKLSHVIRLSLGTYRIRSTNINSVTVLHSLYWTAR